ncbi:hypothetical protein [Rhizobium leguminosarum]|uniref:hypothetical protein n=1 Tax=Rhizobium leguminosarum TaxID=384 RepID=UPI00143F1683|nr:hypothetical protein [Rhizobium leguminosarum]NKL05234.1 hypothetical protein [Rhizobium leguminosarum bv. viciae]NKL82244.1 hypothetical protein [Rhizobium leguminosarum bv. viciae]NKL89957.1 hypothetical protein [Rhizobium leguminosarum bv. viciae]NKM91334.1 hypothetical protein [Rhizobium leguminosarum bv. viciae]
MANKPAKKKICFVVGPIGDDDSEDRIHADWLLEDIITPVFDEHFADFEVTRADKISNPGQITSQVITSLLDAELVIADLTTLNPNAFYEIGIRHTIQKPIIHMHLEGQRIPFDIAPFRSIKFSRRRPADIRAARVTLLAAVSEAVKEDHQVDNPVTFSRGKLDFEQTATAPEKIISDQLASLSRRLAALESPGPYTSGSFALKHFRPRSKFVFVMEVRAGIATTNSELDSFLKDRLDEGFSGISLIEDNGRNQLIEVPDTPGNRRAIEWLKDEALNYRQEIEIIVNDVSR